MDTRIVEKGIENHPERNRKAELENVGVFNLQRANQQGRKPLERAAKRKTHKPIGKQTREAIRKQSERKTGKAFIWCTTPKKQFSIYN